jgi:formate dehydrogenase maturation protein FdhE
VTIGVDSKILTRLEEWERREGTLPKSLEFYRGLLRIQSEARSHIDVPKIDLSEEAISSLIKQGIPLLKFDDLSIDWSLLQKIFGDVNSLVASSSEELGQASKAPKDSSFSLTFLKEASRAWFEGSQLTPWTAVSGISEVLLEAMLHAALRPFLISYCEVLLGSVNQEQWRRGYCPICGGNPDFAFLEKERGGRWLLCARCDAEWLFQRLECPYCGTRNQDALAYFTDDKGLYRLYVCEQCHTYLKAIDLRCAEGEILLPLERVMTLDLDKQGQEKGYRPTGQVGKKVVS